MPDPTPSAPCFICRCEELDETEVRRAIAAGARTIDDVKRRTKAGMGLCQGVFCVPAIAAMIAAEIGAETIAARPMTVRPPLRLVSLESLAALVPEDG